MNSKNIIDAMGGIGFDLIEDAANITKRPRIDPIRISVIAACVCLMIGAALAIPAFYKDESPVNESSNADETLSEVSEKSYMFPIDDGIWNFGFSATFPDGYMTFPDEQGSEAILVAEAFISEVQTKEYSSYTQRRVIDQKYVGERIGMIKVKTFWRNFLTNTDTQINYLDAEVFSIKGVDPDTAVCVKYLKENEGYDTSRYYTLTNSTISAETLSQFFSKLGAQDYFALGGGSISIYERNKDKSDSIHKGYILDSEARDFVKKVILATDGNAIENSKEITDKILDSCEAQAYISCSMVSAGTLSFTMRVLDNGYLLAIIGGSEGYLFEIGERGAQNILDSIREHGRLYDQSSEIAIAETTARS